METKVKYNELDLSAEITERFKAEIHNFAKSKNQEVLSYSPGNLLNIHTTFEGVTYGEKIDQEEPPVAIWEAALQNTTTLQEMQHLNVGEAASATDSLTITFTDGITTTDNVTFSIGYPPYFGSSFSSNDSFTFSRSISHGKSVMKSRTWNYSVDVPVPAKSTVRLKLMLSKVRITLPFSATAQVQGLAYSDLTLSGSEGAINTGRVVAFVRFPLFVPNFSKKVGTLFQNSPHSLVSVVDDNTIRCKLAGVFEGIIGTELRVVSSQV